MYFWLKQVESFKWPQKPPPVLARMGIHTDAGVLLERSLLCYKAIRCLLNRRFHYQEAFYMSKLCAFEHKNTPTSQWEHEHEGSCLLLDTHRDFYTSFIRLRQDLTRSYTYLSTTSKAQSLTASVFPFISRQKSWPTWSSLSILIFVY